MSVMPFRQYGHGELARLEAHVLAAGGRWLEAWSAADCMLQASVTPVVAEDVEAPSWLVGRTDAPALCLDGLYECISGLCLGVEKSRVGLAASPLALSTVQAAIEAWASGLMPGEESAGLSWDAAVGNPLAAEHQTTGALWLDVRIGGQRLSALLPVELAERLLPQARESQPLKPVAIGQLPLEQTVALEVYAAATPFTIQDVSSIRPGDVIRLDQRLGETFELRLKDGPALARVSYGASEGCAAVRIEP